MKKLIAYITICALLTTIESNTIKFSFKGGASNEISIFTFPNVSEFKAFLKQVGMTDKAANFVAKNTPRYNDEIGEITGTIGSVTGGIAGGAAGAIITSESGGWGAIPGEAIGSKVGEHIGKEGTKVWLEGVESFTKGFARIQLRKAAMRYYTSNFWEIVKPDYNNPVCKGIGDLIRKDASLIPRFVQKTFDFIPKQELFTLENPQPIFVVILNGERSPITDKDGNIISDRFDIIFGDYLYPKENAAGKYIAEGGPYAAYNIKTAIMPVYMTDENGKKILKDDNPIVQRTALVALLSETDPKGGITCPAEESKAYTWTSMPVKETPAKMPKREKRPAKIQ